MITKFSVESFKSLEEVEIELGAVNVFVGANGSGKSNLLEAIGVLGAAAFGRVDDESLLRRGVRPGVPQLYKSSFPRRVKEKRPHILFCAENSDASYQVALWNPMNDPSPAWKFKSERLRSGNETVADRTPFRKTDQLLDPEQGLTALRSFELKRGDPARTLLDSLRNYAIYCANTPTLRGLVADPQVRGPIGLSGGRLPQAISELLRARARKENEGLAEKITEIAPLIDWAENFGSANSEMMPLSPSAASSPRVVRFWDRFMAKRRNVLTGYDASEGALYILFAAVCLLHPKSSAFFALDNVDQALNPLLAKRLASAICKWTLEAKHEKQLLVTSHNPAVLDGLPIQDDRVRLFVVDRDDRGHTRVNRVRLDKDLLSKAEQGWTLSRMWMNGLIGGVPDV
jgi:energy-coupling factor transporter ATP-binding protein EcfA2